MINGSPYRQGVSDTGHKIHAVSPGTTYMANPHVRLARSLCGRRIKPSFESFNPHGDNVCGRCVSGVKVRKGKGA